jgi:hypothetical protein
MDMSDVAYNEIVQIDYTTQDIDQLLQQYFESKDKPLFWFLCKYPSELADWAYLHYDKLSTRHQLKFGRLLLHNRYHPKVASLIVRILYDNTDELIRAALTPKPWTLKHKKTNYTYMYSHDRHISNKDDDRFVFGVDDDWVVQSGAYTSGLGYTKKTWRKQYKLCCREFNKRINHYFKMMIRGEYIEYAQFETNLRDGFFGLIACSLVFGVYQDDRLLDLVVVHQGQIQDIQNTPYDTTRLLDKVIAILHPLALPPKHEFLRYMDFVQPFAQLKRSVYKVSYADKSLSNVSKYIGTMIGKTTMRQLARGIVQLRYVNDSIYARFDDTIVRYKYSNMDDEGTLTLDKIIFYKSCDMVYMGLMPLFDKSKSCDISQVHPQIFSEMIRIVAGDVQ